MLRLRRNVLRGVPANFVRNGACESAGNQRGKSRPRGGGGYFVPAPSKGNRRQEQHQIPRPTRGARSLYRRWEETNNGSPTHRQILRNARPCGQKRGDACKRGKHGREGENPQRGIPRRGQNRTSARACKQNKVAQALRKSRKGGGVARSKRRQSALRKRRGGGAKHYPRHSQGKERKERRQSEINDDGGNRTQRIPRKERRGGGRNRPRRADYPNRRRKTLAHRKARNPQTARRHRKVFRKTQHRPPTTTSRHTSRSTQENTSAKNISTRTSS